MIARLRFAWRHKTWSRLAVAPDRPGRVLAYHRGAVFVLPRRCPHQGADLKDARFCGDAVLCPWHGCRFELEKRHV